MTNRGTKADRLDVSDDAWSVSFEAFVTRHSAGLIKTLALITLDQELATDAAQETFLQLHLHWDEARGYENPVAWLYRVGVNRCKDYRRHLARTARLLERLGAAASSERAEDGQWTPERDFVQILRPLPNRQRTAAALYYLADFSIAEIAQAMNISEGAVNSHLHKARESLRAVLEAD